MTILQSIKINAAVHANVSRTSNGVTTAYTAPANSYALVNFYITGGVSDAYINIAGERMWSFIGLTAAKTFPTSTVDSAQGSSIQFYIGPSQVVALEVANFTSGTVTMIVNGVEFKNTT